MGFAEAVRTCIRKYASFSGRAGRAEYWWFFLAVILGSVLFGALDAILFGVEPEPLDTDPDPAAAESNAGPLQALWSLVTVLPLVSAGWRRMHDTGKPGWYILLPFLVQIAAVALILVGVIDFAAGGGMGALGVLALVQIGLALLMLWWLTRPSDIGTNEWGPPPGGVARRS